MVFYNNVFVGVIYMKFVKTEDLKPGMRLAKPIYNKNGVLLYDRNTELTSPGVRNVRNFGLIGIYILEPAEPLPPLSEEDIRFEQLQTVYMFKLRDCLEQMWARKKMDQLRPLVEDILKNYGNLNHRVNFNQNLRSSEDFMYKHAISTAVIVAMMAGHMAMPHGKQLALVTAALFYDIGYRYVPKTVLENGYNLSDSDKAILQQSLEKGLNYLDMYQHDYEFMPLAISLCTAFVLSTNPEKALKPDREMAALMQILQVATTFDRQTAMYMGHEPESEIMAMQHLYADGKTFNPDYVDVLSECIHIVPQAASVDLVGGGKAIVLVENPSDFMHPVILRISDNQIIDLSQPENAKLVQIADIMKTMDNRIVLSEDAIKGFTGDPKLAAVADKFHSSSRAAKAREVFHS